jgi:cytochrome c553
LVSSALTIALTLKLKQLTDTMTRFTLLTALAAAALAPALAVAQTPAPAGDPQKGAQKVQMCQGCHGILGWRTAYPEVYRVPKIGGQHPAYIVAALKEYRSGQRSHPSMDAIAASLTDQDMADVAAYYSQAPLQTAVK